MAKQSQKEKIYVLQNGYFITRESDGEIYICFQCLLQLKKNFRTDRHTDRPTKPPVTVTSRRLKIENSLNGLKQFTARQGVHVFWSLPAHTAIDNVKRYEMKGHKNILRMIQKSKVKALKKFDIYLY